jgi:hypothetical protein
LHLKYRFQKHFVQSKFPDQEIPYD